MAKWFIQKFLPYCPMLGNIHSQISRFFDKIPQHRYCNNIVGVTIGAFTKILAQWDYRQNNHQWCEYHGNRWVAVNNRTARTICWVQKVTSLYCNVAFKTRERHHLCHIMIWSWCLVSNYKIYSLSIHCPAQHEHMIFFKNGIDWISIILSVTVKKKSQLTAGHPLDVTTESTAWMEHSEQDMHLHIM